MQREEEADLEIGLQGMTVLVLDRYYCIRGSPELKRIEWQRSEEFEIILLPLHLR